MPMPMDVAPVTLSGRRVRLEPLSPAHEPGLWEAASDPSIWRWYVEQVHSQADLRRVIEQALAQQATGQVLPFATIDAGSGQPVGSTRFLNIERTHRRVEIGWTWLRPAAQRTAINTEAKYLMMRHAFEVWGCVRVEFKTDSLNERSRAALLRIGAREEGTLRNHFICDTGRLRHSVYYSVLDSEWPTVRSHLEAKLSKTGMP